VPGRWAAGGAWPLWLRRGWWRCSRRLQAASAAASIHSRALIKGAPLRPLPAFAGAQRFLKGDGISIPSAYTSYLSPITSSKLWNDVRAYKDLKHFETPYVVKFHKCAAPLSKAAERLPKGCRRAAELPGSCPPSCWAAAAHAVWLSSQGAGWRRWRRRG
jgi:hypothetical protein